MKYCKPSSFQIIKIPCTFLVERTLSQKIIDLVSRYCDISKHDLKSLLKTRETAEARQLALYFIKAYNPGMTLERIGKFLNRDHATVLNSEKVVLNLIDSNKYFKSKFEFLKREIDNYLK
jgi:chromosomal replication initiator protein